MKTDREIQLENLNDFLSTSFEITEIDKKMRWMSLTKNLFLTRLRGFENSYFWFDEDGNWVFELTKKNDFYCSHKRIWSFFEKEFDMKYNDIQSFIKIQVEEAFKNGEVTTRGYVTIKRTRVEEAFKNGEVTTDFYENKSVLEVEEAFKNGEVTTLSPTFTDRLWVEEDFKMGEVTPYNQSLPIRQQVEEAFKTREVTSLTPEPTSKTLVEEAFKMGEVTPEICNFETKPSVEEAFKIGEIIPCQIDPGIEQKQIEEVFKNGEVTPIYAGSTYNSPAEKVFKKEITPKADKYTKSLIMTGKFNSENLIPIGSSLLIQDAFKEQVKPKCYQLDGKVAIEELLNEKLKLNVNK